MTRDGDSAAQRQHIAAWLAEELPLMLREQPWQKATIVVAGTTELDYKSETEIVVASPTAPFQRVGTELGKVSAQRRLDVDGDSWTASIGEPRPYDSAASDWFVPLTVENGRGQAIWSSRAGGVDAVQALTLALVALGNHLSAERETGRSISYLGGEELGSPVTQVTEGGVVPPATIRFAR